MRKFLYLTVFLILAGHSVVYSQNDSIEAARVDIDLRNYTNFNADTYFGVFIEFLEDYVNGPCGMWAQEIMDRGFDIGYLGSNIGTVWDRSYYPEGNNLPWYTSGGYNPNGEYYLVNMSFMQGGYDETSQTFFYNDTVSYTGYTYVKTNMITGHGKILITNKQGSDTVVNVPLADHIKEWTKINFKIPKGLPYKQLKLVYTVSDTGELDCDEASIVPDNNVMGVRSEWHKLLKELKPGLIRYPGGCFADMPKMRFENGIGNIDFRKSPLLESDNQYLRMDFGTDEFMQYCELLGAEPLLTLNFANADANLAMQWIRYMTADTSDYWGRLRFKNGRLKPYKLHYFEIGNEQRNDTAVYAVKTIPYYDSIKAYNKDYVVIIDGNHYGGVFYLDTLYHDCDGKMDLHSYHPAMTVNNDYPHDEKQILESLCGASDIRKMLEHAEDCLDYLELSPKIRNCITEWWTHWANWRNWFYDTTSTNDQYVMGLANAGMLVSMLEYADRLEFTSRTIGINFIKKFYDRETGDCATYGEPPYDVFCMMNRHHGNKLHNVFTDSQTGGFYHPEEAGNTYYDYTPYIQAAATSDSDSVYIALINRDPYNDRPVNINLLKYFSGGKRYEYYNHELNERKTRDNQEAFYPREVEMNIESDSAVVLPKHSFTILAFALADSSAAVGDAETEAKIFPNPVSAGENVVIRMPGIINPQLTITDARGAKTETEYSVTSDGIILTASKLPAGAYYVSVKYNQSGQPRLLHFKFIKK